MADLQEAANGIRDFLRLRTLPLAMKFFENADDLKSIPKLKRPENKVSFCQVIGLARNIGWTMGVTIDDFVTTGCVCKLGFGYMPNEYDTIYKDVWFKSKEDSVKYAKSIPCFPFGKFKAVAVGPIASGRILSPDLAYIFGTPAQMNLLLNALQYDGYERLHFYFTGEGSCADAFVEAYQKGKPQLTVPCLGERLMGLVQEDELEIAMPANMLQKTLDGLNGLKANHIIGYPIPCFGYQADISPVISRTYPDMAKLMETLKKQNK